MVQFIFVQKFFSDFIVDSKYFMGVLAFYLKKSIFSSYLNTTRKYAKEKELLLWGLHRHILNVNMIIQRGV